LRRERDLRVVFAAIVSILCAFAMATAITKEMMIAAVSPSAAHVDTTDRHPFERRPHP
jgi:hypothetical protein